MGTRWWLYLLSIQHQVLTAYEAEDGDDDKPLSFLRNSSLIEFLKFASDADKELYATIRKQNVLVIDDVTTSGSTLNEILRSLRIVNDDNNITIFSLIGRKDLMADSM